MNSKYPKLEVVVHNMLSYFEQHAPELQAREFKNEEATIDTGIRIIEFGAEGAGRFRVAVEQPFVLDSMSFTWYWQQRDREYHTWFTEFSTKYPISNGNSVVYPMMVAGVREYLKKFM